MTFYQPYIILIIFILIVLFAIIALRSRRHHSKTTTDFRTFFIMGVTWIPIGIVTGNNVFTLIGILFMAFGIANKKKWSEKDNVVDKQQKIILMAIVILLTLIMIFGIIVYKPEALI